jgi:ABC-type polysaccharide/polyol phosphate export permease
MSLPVYDSRWATTSPWRAVVEVLNFKDLLKMLVRLSVTIRYKRSWLGIAWTLINPLLHMGVLTVAFSTLFATHLPRYPVYVFTGLMIMEFFGQTTTFAVNQLVWGSPLLSRVWLPAAVFPLSAIGSGVVNFLLEMLPLGVVMAISGSHFSWHALFFPVPLFLLAIFSLGISLVLASLALHFHDVVNMWNVLLRAWYFLTPIMYPESIFPQKYRIFLEANPLYHILRCFREPLLEGHLPTLDTLLLATGVSFVALALGWWVFSRHRFEFALLG